MPSRGYRKGVSDNKVAHPRQVYVRVSGATYEALLAESADRSLTVSKLLRRVVDAHLAGQTPGIPRRGAQADVVYQLMRLGNNLNQIGRQANLMNLHHIQARAERTLAAVEAAANRL